MGSVYAGLLGDAGNEVWAIDRWADHIKMASELKGRAGIARCKSTRLRTQPKSAPVIW
jgi:2-dehydropantoate 2-reductase